MHLANNHKHRQHIFVSFFFLLCTFTKPKLIECLMIHTVNSVQFCFTVDFGKLIQQRQLLDGQLNENKSVLEELNLLKSDNQV